MSNQPRYIYGRHPVLEALGVQGQDLTDLYILAQDGVPGGPGHRPRQDDAKDLALRLAAERGLKVHMVSRSQLDRMLGRVNGREAVHQGMVLVAAPFAYAELSNIMPKDNQPPLYVVLDQLQDPHNVGAIARSALALGAHALIISKDRSVEVTATVVKAAAGATTLLPIVRVTNISRTLQALKKQGVWIVGTAAESDAQPLQSIDLTVPTALVIGSEGDGMRALTARNCDHLAHIPIVAIGSLNASVAAGICLYEARRQRSMGT